MKTTHTVVTADGDDSNDPTSVLSDQAARDSRQTDRALRQTARDERQLARKLAIARDRMIRGGSTPLGEEPEGVSVPPKATSHTNKEKTMATKTRSPRRVARKVPASAKTATNRCLCGCGGVTRKLFCPGHDARLVGIIMRGETKTLSAAQASFAKTHGIKLGEKRPKAKASSKS